MPEIRVEVPNEEIAVIDGYCHATGKNRTDVIRVIFKEWSEKKLHESIVICRVANRNPTKAD